MMTEVIDIAVVIYSLSAGRKDIFYVSVVVFHFFSKYAIYKERETRRHSRIIFACFRVYRLATGGYIYMLHSCSNLYHRLSDEVTDVLPCRMFFVDDIIQTTY